MRWIILALSLGASITSIIHGVFMLFGSLSIGSGPVVLSSIWLASLPIISAIAALIGGIVAFSGSRWGALFLAIATVLCAFAPREIWIYGGLYCLAAIFCFFLRRREEPINYGYTYEYEKEDGGTEEWDQDEQDEEESPRSMRRSHAKSREPVWERRRTSKICPNCGEMVALDDRFCPRCGAGLHIPASVPTPPEAERNNPAPFSIGQREEEPVSLPREQEPLEARRSRVRPMNIETPSFEENENFEQPAEKAGGNEEESGENMQNFDREEPRAPHRVLLSDSEPSELPIRPSAISVNPDTSYEKFRQYARRSKNPRRCSAGRRILSMLLLLLAVGGALWFLLGLRKLPVGELPPTDRPPMTPKVEEKPTDVLVQPVEPIAENPQTPQRKGFPSFTPSSPKQGVITRTNVNMRSDHTTSSKKVATLGQNTRFNILDSWSGQDYPWYKVRVQNQNREGWVRGDLLQLLGDGLPAGYSNALLLSFGDSKEALTAKLGQPKKSSDSSMDWDGLNVKLSGGKPTQLRLTKAKHELENKLKVGMSQTALYQILGYPTSVNQRQMQYGEGGKVGISVQLNRDGLIQNITVNSVQ